MNRGEKLVDEVLEYIINNHIEYVSCQSTPYQNKITFQYKESAEKCLTFIKEKYPNIYPNLNGLINIKDEWDGKLMGNYYNSQFIGYYIYWGDLENVD